MSKQDTPDVAADEAEAVAAEPEAPAVVAEEAATEAVAADESAATVAAESADEATDQQAEGADGAGERGGRSGRRSGRADRPRREEIPIETKLEVGRVAAVEALELLGMEIESMEAVVDGDQILLKFGRILKPEGVSIEGRVYESLQFILNKSINKHAARRTRLRIEAAGFEGRRGDRVDKAAQALARKVVKLRRPVTLGPLAPADLRQFATQLNRVGGVAVQTVGENDAARLVITPSGGGSGGGGRKRRRGRG